MRQLFYLLYKYRAFAIFVLLELASVALVTTYRSETAGRGEGNHRIMGHIYAFVSDVKAYATLKTTNAQLQTENGWLWQRLLQVTETSSVLSVPPASAQQYTLVPAKVINGSIIHTKNYLTLNKGAKHGLMPGMGVISAKGIVGRVKAVSANFATVVTLLHTDVLVAARLAQSNIIGTVQWNGKTPFSAQLLYVPRHVTVVEGEAVVTSGYNATFFEGIPIGCVKRVVLRPEAPFYEIELSISTDFSTLHHVYVVQDALKEERSALEQHTQNFYE